MFAVVSAGVVLLFFVFQFFLIDKRTNVEKRSAKTQTEQDSSDDDEREIASETKIPFSAYKSFYQKHDPITMDHFSKKWSCEQKGSDFGYSYIELIFLKRDPDNTLKPYHIDRLVYEQEIGKNCDEKLESAVSHHKKSFRVRFPVVKDCHTCSTEFVPEENVRLTQFMFDDGFTDVDYPIQIPPETEINFVSPGVDHAAEIYRYPVIVDDIKKTITKNDKAYREKVTLSIKNAPVDRIKTQVGEVTDIMVAFKKGRFMETTRKPDKNNTYRMNIRLPLNQKSYVGGNIIVTGRIRNMDEIQGSFRNSSKDELPGIQRLMYKRNIQSKEVDMSEGLTYQYNKVKSIKKEITLETYLQKDDIKLDASHMDLPSVVLKKIITNSNGEKDAYRIYAMTPYKRNGMWKTMIEAKPGRYALLIGPTVLDKNFLWPPEKKSK
jgi:hypothetical protein